jgi:hypothetical protein
MKARDEERARALRESLIRHSQMVRALPGIDDEDALDVLLRQMVDSLHRVHFPALVVAREVSARRADPNDADFFDPLRAAAYYCRLGNIEEASWLVFLFVQFGTSARVGYRYSRDVYGRLGDGGRWDWPAVSNNTAEFVNWLEAHHEQIRNAGGAGSFGNHRKYESLKPGQTGRTIATYVDWVGGEHSRLFQAALDANDNDERRAFDTLYTSMAAVRRFGRVARFDYLSMIGKLSIARIAPTFTDLTNASGPRLGTQLLYGVGPGTRAKELDKWLSELDQDLQVGPQVLEDSICNWQKSPTNYRAFRG